MKSNFLGIILMLVLIGMISLVFSVQLAKSETLPEIFITPEESTANIGETFTVNVNISDAEGVFSWEIKVRFDPTILVVSDYESGGFLEQAGSTLPIKFVNYSYMGYVILGLTLSQPGSANGNGTLAKITFKVLSPGYSPIQLYDTLLYNEELTEIPHKTSDGFVYTYVSLVHTVITDGQTFYVETRSNSIVTDFNFSKAQLSITFNVTGPTGTTGWVNVTIPKALLDAPEPNQWTILLDSNPTTYTKTENTTHTYLHINYTHTTHTITIKGTQVIPEFTWTIILLIFTAISTLAILLKKVNKRYILLNITYATQ